MCCPSRVRAPSPGERTPERLKNRPPFDLEWPSSSFPLAILSLHIKPMPTLNQSDTPRQCPVPDCLAPGGIPGRRHAWHYHLTPVPFQLAGSKMSFTISEGKLLCPIPRCPVTTNRRDRATKHMRDAHDLPQDIHVFDGPIGTCQNRFPNPYPLTLGSCP